MKNYLTTNKLTIRGYLWRAFVATFVLGTIAIIAGAYRLTSSNNIEKALKSKEVAQGIEYIGTNIMQKDQQITISSGTLVSSPETITFYSDNNTTLAVDTTKTCTDFFNKGKQGVLATKEALCFVDSRHKQQVVTRTQINTIRKEIKTNNQTELNLMALKYSALTKLITEDTITLNPETMKAISENLTTATQDPLFIAQLKTIISFIKRPLIIGCVIALFFITLIFVPIVLLLPALFFALMGQGIVNLAGGQKITFEQSFSRTRLPSTIAILIGIYAGRGRPVFILGVLSPIIDAIFNKD